LRSIFYEFLQQFDSRAKASLLHIDSSVPEGSGQAAALHRNDKGGQLCSEGERKRARSTRFLSPSHLLKTTIVISTEGRNLIEKNRLAEILFGINKLSYIIHKLLIYVAASFRAQVLND